MAGERLVVDALEFLEVDVRVREVEQVALRLVLEILLALGRQILGVGDEGVEI